MSYLTVFSWSTPEPLRECVCQEDISGKGYIPLNTRENWITTVFYNMPWKYNGQHNQCNIHCMCSVLERLDVIVYCRIYMYDSFPVIYFLTVFSMELTGTNDLQSISELNSVSCLLLYYSINVHWVGNWCNLYFENLALNNYKFGKKQEGITFILAYYNCWKVETT